MDFLEEIVDYYSQHYWVTKREARRLLVEYIFSAFPEDLPEWGVLLATYGLMIETLYRVRKYAPSTN